MQTAESVLNAYKDRHMLHIKWIVMCSLELECISVSGGLLLMQMELARGDLQKSLLLAARLRGANKQTG